MNTHASLVQNPGSVGSAAAGAFAGRIIGGLPGLFYGMRDSEGDGPLFGAAAMRWGGQIAGSAGGAALGAPDGLKGRAAIGAAIGGAVPVIGAPLAAVGAYLATRPEGRQANPMSPPATIALAVLGLAAVGGLAYAGMKALEARRARLTEGGEDAEEAEVGNIDEWGWDLDKYELWGLGPVIGTDGKEYFYRIYESLETGKYELSYRGDTASAGEGPFDTPTEVEWCIENRLPLPCLGYPGE